MSFDPSVISYKDLLVVFMTSHDPTTLNKQGGDVGSQYRSVIYYNNEQQKTIAQLVAQQMVPYYENPIVTEISLAETFHKAEVAHQQYFATNQDAAYCSVVIVPKLKRLRVMYANKLKNVNV